MTPIRAIYVGLSVVCALFFVIVYKWETSTTHIKVTHRTPSTTVANDFVTNKLLINYALKDQIASLVNISSIEHVSVVNHDDRPLRYTPDSCDINQPTNYIGLIVVDWVYKSDLFSFINYKSFESLLQVYPRSEVHVHLIAPLTANYYKIGDFLSKHQLQKYIKMGYNVQIKVLSDSLDSVDSYPTAATPPIGSDYWQAGLDQCCQHKKAADIARKRPMVPLHLYFYRRILSLYSKGGIYSDFSWYHIRALHIASSLSSASPRSAVSMKDKYSLGDALQTATEQMKSSEGVESDSDRIGTGDVHGAIVQLHCKDPMDSGEEETCSSSMLMAFSRHSPVLRCMLLQYNSTTSSLLQCLQPNQPQSENNNSGGTGENVRWNYNRSSSTIRDVKCITESLQQCFQSNNVSNDFLRMQSNKADVEPVISIPNESSMKDHHRGGVEEVVLGCNKPYLLSKAVVDFLHDDHHLADEQIEWMSSVANMGDVCAPTSTSTSSEYDDLVWGSYGGVIATELIHCSCNATACSRVIQSELYSAIWLGGKSMDGSWSTPAPDSILSFYLNSSVPLVSRVPGHTLHRDLTNALAIRSENLMGLLDANGSPCAGVGVSCGRTALERVVQQYRYHLEKSKLKVLGRTKRAEYDYYRFANENNRVTTYNELYHSIFDMSNASSCRKYQSTDRSSPSQKRQASLSCGPSFVVPGFMKAGTTFLFGVLTRHPHVLNTLRGVGFKETGCYLPSSRTTTSLTSEHHNHMNCFPFVEPEDRMRFGDGTVWYMFRSDVQELLLADNPAIKLVVCIRDPVERTVSHHRFYYKQLSYKNGKVQDINEILGILFDRSEGNIMDWHDLAWAIVRERNATHKALLVASLQSVVFAGLKPMKQKRYKVYGQMLVHSLYFPAIHYWHAKIQEGHLLVVPVDALDTRRVTFDLKSEYIRNFTGSDPRQTNASEHNDVDQAVNKLYLLHQYNRIFRFLGLEEMTRVYSVGPHAMDASAVPQRHQLNTTMRAQLHAFFRPFNLLLEQFLDEPLGYSREDA